MNEAKEAFERLVQIMDELREKCPWDQKQTFESLRHLTLEEVYELSDAIVKVSEGGEDSPLEIKKELGDVMLHLVFYAKIAAEKGWFTLADVLNGICEKLIVRHPHIYGSVEVKDENDVKRNWEKIKLAQGNTSVLQGVPTSLPALIKASRIQEKTAGVGFDWKEKKDVWMKVEEEIKELQEAEGSEQIASPSQSLHIEEEYGDLLFSLVNYARFIKVNPETALEKANRKFIKRFQFIETNLAAEGASVGEQQVQRMEELWNASK